jgi:hypothetical protein
MSDSLSRYLPYDDMRAARRQILAVQDPQAQDALFTVLGLLARLAEQLDRQPVQN